MNSRQRSTPRLTDSLTVSCNVTLIWSSVRRGFRITEELEGFDPVPKSITGPPCSWEYKYGNLALQVGGVSNLRQKNMVTSSVRLRPYNDRIGEDQQHIQRTAPFSQRERPI
jgi:hypothetical protein